MGVCILSICFLSFKGPLFKDVLLYGARILVFNSYKPGILFLGHRQTVNATERCIGAQRGVSSWVILFAYRNFTKKMR